MVLKTPHLIWYLPAGTVVKIVAGFAKVYSLGKDGTICTWDKNDWSLIHLFKLDGSDPIVAMHVSIFCVNKIIDADVTVSLFSLLL